MGGLYGLKRARERGRYRESRHRAAERQKGRETEKRKVTGGWEWGEEQIARETDSNNRSLPTKKQQQGDLAH